MESRTYSQRIKDFFKVYGYYIALFTGTALFITLIILANIAPIDKDRDGVDAQITYHLPVLDATIHKGYSSTALQYNETLNQWEAHKAIDFVTAAGSNVYAILDGVVKEIYTNYLEGTVVLLEHANGIKSEYGSLSENLTIKVGDTVSANQVIGKVSNSANCETLVGAHLHFAMYDNDNKKVDPAGYLNIEAK